MNDELMKRVLESVSPRNDERFYEAVRRNPEESQAQWNAIAMRNMVAQQGRNLVEVIKNRVTDLEAQLQKDESLTVYCDAGKEQIQVEPRGSPKTGHRGSLQNRPTINR